MMICPDWPWRIPQFRAAAAAVRVKLSRRRTSGRQDRKGLKMGQLGSDYDCRCAQRINDPRINIKSSAARAPAFPFIFGTIQFLQTLNLVHA